MKHAHIVANERLPHQGGFGGAFGEGLRKHGWQVTASSQPEPCDLMVLWGTRQREWIGAQKRAGGEVVVLERGYVGDRFEFSSVSFGGELNGRAQFRGPFHDGSRFERHHGHLLKSWRERRDGYALLIGQVPGDMSVKGVDIDAWYRRTAAELSAAGWDVRFRQHPVAAQRGYSCQVPGVPTIGGDLASALDGAAIVCSFNSNTGVESVLAGVPTITYDKGAMAWPVAGHAIGEIATPDRTAWAHALAWKQFTRDELASGFCWDAARGTSSSPTTPDLVF